MLHINVLGLAGIEQDVTADLARATIASCNEGDARFFLDNPRPPQPC